MSRMETNYGHRSLRKGRFSAANNIYFITAATVDRSPLFSEWLYARAAINGFTQTKLLGHSRLLCWVLMPDHVHWLIQLADDTKLSTLVGSMKSASARLTRRAGCSQSIWAPAFYDHALREEDDIRSVARYIAANPLRAGLVDRLGGYPYWDAVWL